MLAITRRIDEEIFVGDDITVTVIRARRGRVTLGITAPPEVSIVRGGPATPAAETERPDGMNYVEEVRSQLAKLLPDLDPALLDLYTLLGLEFGTTTDVVMVHNAWAVWQNRTQPDHRSLIPFPYLTPAVQALDEPYADAIRQAIRMADEAKVLDA